MSYAFNSIKGITYYNMRRAYAGYTLFTPTEGWGVWLIDMMGNVVRYWDMDYRPGPYGELLLNGHLLYAGRLEEGPIAGMEGAGGVLVEVDRHGGVVWKYEDPYLHHGFCRMENGNTLVMKWEEIPEEIEKTIQGGFSTEARLPMWGDVIQEIRPDGAVAWEWRAVEYLDPALDRICPLCPRMSWAHANACIEGPDNTVIVSFMRTNTVAIVNKSSGQIVKRIGRGRFTHQHAPSLLDNGNILLFDNGFHEIYAPNVMSRVLEIRPDDGSVGWSFGGNDEKQLFYSSTMSNAQRLPNGNTFICEGTWGRLFEITPEGELVWEYVNPYPEEAPRPREPRSYPVYSAYRLGMDHPGIRGGAAGSAKRRSAPTLTREDEPLSDTHGESDYGY